jgi:hypothetical protein
MKRVKIMLLSLSLLAVVGGALAFKAKFLSPICYTDVYNIALGKTTCPTPKGVKSDILKNTTFHTTTVNAGSCSYKDQFDVDQPLTCASQTISSTFD